MSHPPQSPLSAGRARALSGRVRVPGDKSISHRALMFGALATGRTQIAGLLEGEDVLNTAKALQALGAPVAKVGATWEVLGRGVGGLAEPAGDLDFGNSGTGVRLMMGVLAGHDMRVRLTGDASLSRRPMGRVLTPLRQMGLQIEEDGRDRLPLTIRGSADLLPIEYRLPVASAQIKSAVLIAGLHAPGATTVIEGQATRDHTERMLRHFGAARDGGRARRIALHHGCRRRRARGPRRQRARRSQLRRLPGQRRADRAGLRDHHRGRAGQPDAHRLLRDAGARWVPMSRFRNQREEGGEPVADLLVRHSKLKGVRVPPERAPSMIDEYPVLACLAAYAEGETRMEGLSELKVKESDRLAATAAGLGANGVPAKVEGDTLIVGGRSAGASVRGGGTVATHLDHRIAMAFLTLGLGADRPVTVDDADTIATSFPEFRGLMEGLGATFAVPEGVR